MKAFCFKFWFNLAWRSGHVKSCKIIIVQIKQNYWMTHEQSTKPFHMYLICNNSNWIFTWWKYSSDALTILAVFCPLSLFQFDKVITPKVLIIIFYLISSVQLCSWLKVPLLRKREWFPTGNEKPWNTQIQAFGWL